MKKIFFSIVFLLIIASCNYIALPKEDFVTAPAPPDTVIRRVLLEDYTGHECVPCVSAGTQATWLKQQYGEKLIVIGVHAGVVAEPNMYPEDFTTTAGDAYYNFFGFAANPIGMVNRIGYPDGAHDLSWGAWASAVSNIIYTPPVADIEISASLASSQLTVSATTKFVSQKTGLYRIVAMVTEDSIVAPQSTSSGTNPNYVHRHVLRGTIPDANYWGDTLFYGTVAPNDVITKNFPVYTIGGTWNPNQLHVVVFIYDDDINSPTYKEILQAEEKKLN